MRVWELRRRLNTATGKMRAAGLPFTLSIAELFSTRRVAHLPAKVRKMWAALNTLEPQEIGHVTWSYASPAEVIFRLSDLSCAAASRHGIGSPEHEAAKRALFDAMYGEGMTLESYNAAQVVRRRDAANIGY